MAVDRRNRAPAADPPLERLLARVAEGDRGAFASLYHRSAGMIFGLARGIAGDRARAERVTEDVFAEIWRTAPRFRAGQDSAINWIFTIARCHTARQSALTETQCHALLLTCYGGYAQDQIADLLGIPAAGVPELVRDGLLHLQGQAS